MRLIVISLSAIFLAVLAMFLIVWPALNGPQEDYNKGLSAYEYSNYETAIKLFHQAAERGVAEAQFRLGYMYVLGEGAARDDKKAVKWYRQAAEQGYAEAQFNLGVMYLLGWGVAKDYKTAVKLYRQAAEQGYAVAQANLGNMYYNSKGVAQDYKTAIKWYRLAAEQGSAGAQVNLGFMYERGEGVVQNTRMAYMFYLLALANNEDESLREKIEKAVTLTESILTPTQKQRAQNAAAKYQARIDARQ